MWVIEKKFGYYKYSGRYRKILGALRACLIKNCTSRYLRLSPNWFLLRQEKRWKPINAYLLPAQTLKVKFFDANNSSQNNLIWILLWRNKTIKSLETISNCVTLPNNGNVSGTKIADSRIGIKTTGYLLFWRKRDILYSL